jgi:hypothetical protein
MKLLKALAVLACVLLCVSASAQVRQIRGEVSNFPLRLYYPINEVSSNPINWAAATKNLPGGRDVVSAKLFWEP